VVAEEVDALSDPTDVGAEVSCARSEHPASAMAAATPASLHQRVFMSHLLAQEKHLRERKVPQRFRN
jgi:hypothetical protein